MSWLEDRDFARCLQPVEHTASVKDGQAASDDFALHLFRLQVLRWHGDFCVDAKLLSRRGGIQTDNDCQNQTESD